MSGNRDARERTRIRAIAATGEHQRHDADMVATASRRACRSGARRAPARCCSSATLAGVARRRRRWPPTSTRTCCGSREVGQPRVYWTTLAWKVLRAGGRRARHDVLPAGQPRAVSSAERHPQPPWRPRHPRARRDRRRAREPRAAAGRPVAPARAVGATAPTSARATRCSTATSASSSSRCRCSRRSPAGCSNCVLMAGVADARRVRARSAGCGDARRHLLALAAVGAAVMAWRCGSTQFALGVAARPARSSPARLVHRRPRAAADPARLRAARAGRRRAVRVRRAAAGASRRRLVVPVGAVGLLAAAISGAAGADRALRRRAAGAVARAPVRRATRSPRPGARSRSTTSTCAPAGTAASCPRRRSPTHRDTLENVPLWDSRVLRPAMNETQSIGGYYGFPSTDRRPLTAHRADDRRRAPARARAPVARRRAAGPTRTSPTRTATGSSPCRAARPTPTATRASRSASSTARPARPDQPRIYFGERAPRRPAVRDPRQPPRRGRAARARHAGARVPLRRHGRDRAVGLAAAARVRAALQRPGAALTETLDGRSRIAIHRDARERRARRSRRSCSGTPSRRRSSPAAACSSCLHGYTTSAAYPYSARVAAESTTCARRRSPSSTPSTGA